jgi:hypothetical protein
MEARIKIEEMVLELLGVHSCVTLPGLGSFIYRESQASSNTFTFELRPSLRTVFFNSAIVADDGLLANRYGELTGISFSQAQNQLSETIAEIKTGLEKSRNLVFGKLGNFFLNGENQIFFFPSPSLNLSHDTFGLPVIKLDELEKPKQAAPVLTSSKNDEKAASFSKEETETFEEAEVLFVEESAPRKRSWIWKAAAAIAILMLAGTGTYFGRKLFTPSSPGKQSQAAIDTPVAQNSATDQVENNPVTTTAPTTEPEPEKATTESIPQPAPQIVEETAPVLAPEVTKEEAKPASTELSAMEQLQAAKGKYFVVGGKYLDENLARLECRGWNNRNIRAVVFKAENSSLYKVILQRFSSADAAQAFIGSLPPNGATQLSVKEFKNFK